MTDAAVQALVEECERRPLERVLADYREEAKILTKHGDKRVAKVIERFATDVSEAEGVDEYLRWVSEDDAMLRSGRSLVWFRKQFPEWERMKMARRRGRRREYRLTIVPTRANLTAAAAAGRAAAHEAARA